MPNKNEREYRSVPMMSPAEDGHVRGYATTFEQPYVLFEDGGIQYKEVIARDALAGADLSDVVMLHNHSGMVFARTRNKSLVLSTDEHGLAVDADLTLTQKAREHREAIDAGLVDKMSWGFVVKEDSYNRETHTRRILKIKKVYDVSTVDFPANPETCISTRAFFDGEIEKEKQELLEREAIERQKQKIKILLEV